MAKKKIKSKSHFLDHPQLKRNKSAGDSGKVESKKEKSSKESSCDSSKDKVTYFLDHPQIKRHPSPGNDSGKVGGGEVKKSGWKTSIAGMGSGSSAVSNFGSVVSGGSRPQNTAKTTNAVYKPPTKPKTGTGGK